MNAKKKIHKLHLEQWTARFRDQASSGLTVKQWCAQNNFTTHNYYYWKRILREEYVDSMLPDIVPVFPLPDAAPSEISGDCHSQELYSLYNPHDSHNTHSPDSIHIRCSGYTIDLCSNVSLDILTKVLKAVKHA